MTNLIDFFIRRPLIANLMMVFFVIIGIAALSSLRYNSYPMADTGVILIETAFPGASANDVELSVTKPLEDELLHVDGVKSVMSNSVEGLSTILVQCNPNDTIDKYDDVEKDIRSAIDRALRLLPDGLPMRPEVTRPENTKNIPLMQVLVTGTAPENTLRDITRTLQLELRALKGVAGVTREGYREREIKVLLDELKIRQLGLSYNTIVEAVNKRNVRASGGSLDSVAGEQDVLALSKFNDPKDIEDVIIFEPNPGNIIRIKDVARVVYDFSDPVVQSRVNGERAVSLYLLGEELADRLSTARRVKAYIEQRNPQLPENVELVIVNDDSTATTAMLDVLVGNALAGMLLVFLVLLAFFEFRMSIWVVLGIPVSIMMVFAVMPFMGTTINVLSMASLILMLGILVDDAVVTAESIFRHSEYGHPPAKAALLGTKKVLLPVAASAATTIATLAPAAFLGGIQGKAMWIIPVIAIVVLLMSLFECIFILPSHLAHSLEGDKNKRLSRKWFEAIEDGYESLMMHVVPKRYLIVPLILCGFVVMAVMSSKMVVMQLSPETNADTLYIKVEAPVGTSFVKMESKLIALEQELRGIIPADDLHEIIITTGHHDYDLTAITEGRNVSWGMISIFLKPANHREINALELRSELQQLYAQKEGFQRIDVRVQRVGADFGWPLETVVIGNSDDRFVVADIISDFVNSIPGVTEHWSDYVAGKPVVSLKLDYEALSRYGLTVEEVSSAVKVAYTGVVMDTYQSLDENISYRLMLDNIDSSDFSSLYSLSVTNKEGKTIFLRSLVEFEQQSGEGTIYHHLGRRATTVYVDVDTDVLLAEELHQKVNDFIRDEKISQRFPNLTVYIGGEPVEQAEQKGGVAKALGLSLIGVTFILIMLFNSLLQPLMVILLIPLGVIGVFFVFGLHGMPMSTAGLLGVAGLMGVIVNDALVMLDGFNLERTLHSKSKPTLLHDRQIIECASLRLRPIVITTVTTCAGLFPAAYGLIGSNDLITPLIMVMLWGVMVASATTLFLLPCLYAMERDLLGRLKPSTARQTLDEVIMYN